MPSDNNRLKAALYRDPAQPVEARVSDLLARMTLAEKIAQMGSIWVYELFENLAYSEPKAQALLSQGMGQITRIGGASSLGPSQSAALANRIQEYLVEQTRLGIPAIVHEECCSGYMARDATCFPQIIGVASSWEPELVEAMAEVIRIQMRAVGAHQGLSPVLDIARDPRWGRVEETYGEDPYLVARLGVSFVKGLQGEHLREGILATGKHFVGYGASEGGMNWAPARLPARELREVYLLPFEAAVKEAGLASIMNAYQELDGIPCGSSRELLTDILRREWGFDGIVVSDYFAINQLMDYHHVARDKDEAALMAMEAGLDVELPSTDCYGQRLQQAVERGLIPESLIDEVVGRILRMKFQLELFEKPYVAVEEAAAAFDTPDQRALARRIAQQSIVLLKNEGELLPLKKELATIAVIGPNADNVRHLIGDYAYPCHIESLVAMREEQSFGTPIPDKVELVDNFVPIFSILHGIKGKVSTQTQVLYAKGCDVLGDSRDGFAEAVEIARQADVAIVVVGDKSGLTRGCTTGESRDRVSLGLPGVQEELVRAVAGAGTPVVVVLANGRPLAIPWLAEHVPAIVEAWLPGEEGADAVADVLFGKVNPGGKLPISLPRDAGQVPVYYAHKPSGGRSHWLGDYVEMSPTPLFPFGHGLSYTHFEYANLRISPAQVDINGQVTISLNVTNAGQRAGDEVVQLYLHDAAASITRPVKELKGFKRLSLEPGQTKTVAFTVPIGQLGFYNREMAFVVEPGETEVMIGSSSEDIRLTGAFEITGETRQLGMDKVFFSDVRVE